MELEEGKIYTTQQMQKFMGISKSTWDHRRDELLENFCLYYEYEVVYEGRSTKYHILRKLGDYQKPLSKRSKELRDQIYEEYQPPPRAEMETVWKIRLPPWRNTAVRRL